MLRILLQLWPNLGQIAMNLQKKRSFITGFLQGELLRQPAQQQAAKAKAALCLRQ